MRDNDAPLLLDVSRMVWRRWSGMRQTGIDRICRAWLEHYAPRAQAVIVHRRAKTILPERTSEALFRLLLGPERGRRDVADFRRRAVALGLWQGQHLRDKLPGRGRVWLNPGHTGLDVDGLAEWCARRDLRPVYLVHDLIPITHPQFCREGEDERHRQRMRTMLATAAGVVTNSAHTLETFAAFAREECAEMPPAIVAWPGTPRLPTPDVCGSGEATFVVLGTIEGRKNHKLLLSVWQGMLARSRSEPRRAQIPRLVIVGRRGWQADEVFHLLDRHDFGGLVDEVGPLDDARLAAVLKGARALLFPSHAEGYGIPLAEALAAGVPVLASDLPVFREIGQGVPELLPAADPETWRHVIEDYARPGSERRARQLERMMHFQAPSWEEHFGQVDRLVASLSD
jgi:glycosyltransferase involved in cell wall biosynthesis